MKRTLFDNDHESFRSMIRDDLAREVVGDFPAWTAAGETPRAVFEALGRLGVMGMNMPVEYGGSAQDYRFNVVLQEETARAGVTIGPLRTHLDVVLPYFIRYASEEQRDRWFPGLAAGTLMTSIAMTEPNSGSDVAGIQSTAKLDGDSYVLNGAKTYITGGLLADLVIVAARTSKDPADRRSGLTLLVVEDGMTGFTKGRKLPKIGLHAQDTIEMAFEDVRVPVANRLGSEGHAFSYLTHSLAQERLAIAVGAVAQAQAAVDLAVQHVQQRVVFGSPLSSFQNTKFELAAVSTAVTAAQCLLDAAVSELLTDELDPADSARVKLFCTEVQGQVIDRCLQLFGGFGYVTEAPIARLYADARVSRIYGGTSEVMKLIISKSLGL